MNTMTNHPYTETDFHERNVFYFNIEPEPAWTIDLRHPQRIKGTDTFLGITDDNNKILEESVSPFKVGDKIYFAEEWYEDTIETISCRADGLPDVETITVLASEFQWADDDTYEVQPALTMPIELAEHFKTITKVGVVMDDMCGNCNGLGELHFQNKICGVCKGAGQVDKKWHWKVEVE